MILFNVYTTDKEGNERDWYSYNNTQHNLLLSLNASSLIKTLVERTYPELTVTVQPVQVREFKENNVQYVRLRNVDYYSKLQIAVYPVTTNQMRLVK